MSARWWNYYPAESWRTLLNVRSLRCRFVAHKTGTVAARVIPVEQIEARHLHVAEPATALAIFPPDGTFLCELRDCSPLIPSSAAISRTEVNVRLMAGEAQNAHRLPNVLGQEIIVIGALSATTATKRWQICQSNHAER